LAIVEREEKRSTRVMHRFKEEAKREKKMTESARIDSLNSGDRRRRSRLACSCLPCSERHQKGYTTTTTPPPLPLTTDAAMVQRHH